MSIDIQVNSPISTNSQFLEDQNGNKTPITVSSSKVGIATDAPSANLSIKATSVNPSETFNIQHATSGDSIIAMMQGTNGHGNLFVRRTDGKDAVKLAGGGSSYVNVDTNGGNFGIGTRSPQAMLEVNGEARCTGLTVTSGNTISLMSVPRASTAPDQGRLEGLLIDPSTGKLYYQ